MQDPRGLARRRQTGCLPFPRETWLVGQGTLSCSLRLAPDLPSPLLRELFSGWSWLVRQNLSPPLLLIVG